MNWYNILKSIYQKLEDAGYTEIKEDIHEGQLSGGTGGEIFLIVITKLIELKSHNPSAYMVVKMEIDQLINYGKSINYW